MTADARILTPLTTPAELATIAHGDVLHIQLTDDVAVEGVIGKSSIARSEYRAPFNMHGIRMHTSWPNISRVTGPTQERKPVRRTITAEEIKAFNAPVSRIDDRPEAFSIVEIIEQITGLPLTRMADDFTAQAHLRAARPFVNVPALTRLLDELTADGTLTRAKTTGPHDNTGINRIVTFNRTRSGWVFTADYNASKKRVAAAADDARVAKLRAEAERIVAARHQDEVDEELERLLAE